MKISVITPGDLDATACDTWRALQLQNPALASPYFAPELTQAVAAARDDVRVAVLEDGPHVVGYFPYQRNAWGACSPVGGALSDHHGVIAADGTAWDWQELLRATAIEYWRFDHLVATQAPMPVSALRTCVSPALDLSRGFLPWRSARIQASRRVAELERKARKLAREVGPLRFDAHSLSPDVLERVFTWKSEQCRATGAHDFFGLRWTRALVERILHTRKPGFVGALSALYAGDTLVAANMGMRSDTTWHWWFPVYDHAFARYSPGALLLLRVAEAAAEIGVGVLDLGKGDDGYKDSFADMYINIAEGFIARPSLLNAARGASVQAEWWLRDTSVFDSLRPTLRQVRQRTA